MREEKQTRENLLAAAKQEFMEKGYHGASLRSMCREAGVTTGALYFFFKDKEELFSEIVQQQVRELYHLIESHFVEELATDLDNKDIREDLNSGKELLRYLYAHKDIFMLLLTKAQGSRYENIMDEIIALSDRHYRALSDVCAKKYHTKNLDDYTIHWFSHIQIDTFAQFLVHDLTVEEAERHLGEVIDFMFMGWKGFFGK